MWRGAHAAYLGEAVRALLVAVGLDAHVLGVRARGRGGDALGVVREVRARAATAGAVLGAVHGAPGLGEARVAAEAGEGLRGDVIGACVPEARRGHFVKCWF